MLKAVNAALIALRDDATTRKLTQRRKPLWMLPAARGIGFFSFYAPPKKLGAVTFYLATFLDADGQRLSGEKNKSDKSENSDCGQSERLRQEGQRRSIPAASVATWAALRKISIRAYSWFNWLYTLNI